MKYLQNWNFIQIFLLYIIANYFKMKFIKYVLATLTGLFLFIGICFFTLFLVGTIASTFGKKGEGAKPNSVLYASFSNSITEKTDKSSPFAGFDPLTLQPQKQDGLNDLLAGIESAKTDDNIKGIFLELKNIAAGFATNDAIRDALIDFKTSGKWIVTYGELYGQQAYYLASVADSILLNPTGVVSLIGFRSEKMFYKGALDKLEIEPQVFRVGEFKSFVEPFILTKMSEENRKQTEAFLKDFYDIFIDGIADGRNITKEELNEIVDQLKVQRAEDALTYGLVDKLTYKDEALNIIKEKLGLEQDAKITTISLSKYSANKGKKIKKGTSRDKIAVVYAYGNIVDGVGKNGTIGSYDYEKVIRKIREKDDVKAIVLRVNSGGGSALASDVIWYEMETAKSENIPIVVSMGDLAASGGYYIACNADYIFAEENTITGSIGVFGLMPNMEGFFNNKLGITFDVAKTTEFADFGSIHRPLNEAERSIFQTGVDDIYDTFLQRVANGRDMPVDEVHKIAQGRVWSGLKAKEIGLIDGIGNLNDAIAKAAELADIDSYRVSNYPASEDPFTKLMKDLGAQSKQNLVKEELGPLYKYYKEIKELTAMKGIQMRLPQQIVVE